MSDLSRAFLVWGFIIGLAIASPTGALCDNTIPGPRLPILAAGDLASNQLKFQFDLSLWVLTTRAHESGVYAAYQQRGLWDLDHNDKSYRVENNFQPELGMVLGPATGHRLIDRWPAPLSISVAYVHESDGLQGELSRGWNRAVGGIHFGSIDSTFHMSLRGWYAFRVEDTNDNLSDYAGVGDVRLVTRVSQLLGGHFGNSSIRLKSAFSPDASHSRFFTNLEAGLYFWPGFMPDWILPGKDERGVDFVVEWFVGYGEFLVDYAESTNRIRFGLALPRF